MNSWIHDPFIRELVHRLLEIEDHKKYVIKDDLVYRNDGERLLFVVPNSIMHNVIRSTHDELSRIRLDKATHAIMERFWFPCMKVCVLRRI